MPRRPDKKAEARLARERIAKLDALAAAAAVAGRLDRAARYGALARALAMRHQLPFPRAFARRLCRACGAYLVPGRSSRVRLRPGRLVVSCLACGDSRRYPRGMRAAPKKPRSGTP